MRRAGGEFNHVTQCPHLFAGARAHQVELRREAKARRIVSIRLRLADDAQGRARRIQMDRFRWEEPVFEFADEFLFLLGFLDFGETIEVGVSGQFRGRRAAGAEKQECEFFQARFSLGREQTRPPVRRGKIPAGKRELLEVILEQQPGPL